MIQLLPQGSFDGTSAVFPAVLTPNFSLTLRRMEQDGGFCLTRAAPPMVLPQTDGTILLCRGGFQTAPPRPTDALCRIGVLQSNDLEAAKALSTMGIPAITCGMAVTDTLTFSSLTEESAVVCLQRATPTLDGVLVEPCELPLRLSRAYDRFTLMSLICVYLLTGNWEQLSRVAL